MNTVAHKRAFLFLWSLVLCISLPLASQAKADTPQQTVVTDRLIEEYGEELGLDDISIADINIGALLVPTNSSTHSDVLAIQLQEICVGQSAPDTQMLFSSAGFEVLSQQYYEKDPYDPSHTSAYTIGFGRVLRGLAPQDALLVCIRGTSSGEWFSNFDFCPSHSDLAVASENFLFAASDIFLKLKDYIDAYPDALVILCGHSRGGACANLLGLLVNAYTDPSKVYTYTFASPATLHAPTESQTKEPSNLQHDGSIRPDDSNIFNYINDADFVPLLPLEAWGFLRAGTDIYLESDEEELPKQNAEYIKQLSGIAPSIAQYYSLRHALDREGTSDSGITSFELMLLMCREILDLAQNATEHDPMASTLSDVGLSEQISKNSDIYPLLEIYQDLCKDDYRQGLAILRQHLPTTYIRLLANHLGMDVESGKEK